MVGSGSCERLLGAGLSVAHHTLKRGGPAGLCLAAFGERDRLDCPRSREGDGMAARLRLQFPAQEGSLGSKPTVINNVETLAVVPWIPEAGRADAFAAHGTKTSKGTKVFALRRQYSTRRVD